jgi:putative hydrolase of the HAD superfamily
MVSDPPIEIVSWDVDGTLYDLGRLKRTIAWQTLGGLCTRPLRTVREHARLRRFRRAMNRVRARGGALGPGDLEQRDQLLALEQHWYGRALARAGLRAGVRELIDDFAARGLRQIVVSDYEAAYKLRILGLDGVFEHVYAGERLGYLKPSPELFAAVARDLDIEPQRILHLGDRADRDVAAAAAAGCQAALIGRGQPDPRRLLSAARGDA